MVTLKRPRATPRIIWSMPKALMPLALLAASLFAAGSAVMLASVPAQRRPTFAADIAPIILERCASCHRPGRPSPFSLLSYDDVRPHVKEILAATQARTMPPWLATQGAGFPALKDDPRLTDKQIAMITTWVRNETPSGNLRKAPQPTSYPLGWPLGAPDLTVEVPRVIAVEAGENTVSRTVVVPIDFPTDLWVSAIDYQRGDAGIVKFANLFIAPPDLRITDDDALPGVGGLLGTGSLENYGDQLLTAARGLTDAGAWVPSFTRRLMPDNLSLRIPPRWNIVVRLHIQAGKDDAAENGRIGVYFAKPVARRAVKPISVPPALGIAAGLSIPAGATRHVVRDTFELPVDVEAVGARAYANALGRDLTMQAELPDRTVRSLLRIDRWDAGWPDTYYFETPIKLPKGTTIRVEIAYDNSEDNPRNLFSPPRRIGWGRMSVGEVGSRTLLVVSPSADHGKTIDDAVVEHLRRQLMGR
jgi:mono/diheme cytochrome c family protein